MLAETANSLPGLADNPTTSISGPPVPALITTTMTLLTLKHKGCRAVRYNESTCTLASYGDILKLWTPFRLPELISSYIEENGNTASRHGSDQENLISEPNENDGNSNRYEEEAEMSSSSGGDGGSVSVSISTNDEDSDISIGEDMNTSLVQSSSGLWRV